MASIFDKFKEGMEQVVTGAQDKIQEAQLRAQLKTMEKEKTDQITALGSVLYGMYHAGDIQLENLTLQFQAIQTTEAKIDEKQHEIDTFLARAASQAPSAPQGDPTETDYGINRHCSCGAVLSPAARFCPECGRAQPVEGI
jgi:hypothetical protein